MFTLLSQIIAYSFVFVIGYLSLSLLIRGTNWVFLRWEFWLYSFLFGIVIVPFLMFLMGLLGIRLALIETLIVLLVTVGILGYFFHRLRATPHYTSAGVSDIIGKKRLITLILGSIVLVKLVIGATMIVMSPTYQDDTFANWNMRGKIFAERQSLVLDMTDPEYLWTGYKQYPLTPSLFKTYLSLFAPNWDDSYINLPSLLFFLASLGIIFFIVFRITKSQFLGFLASYTLLTLPLYYIHGTNPYFDIFQAVYFLMGLSFAFLFLEKKLSILPVGVAIGLLTYTKSEGLIIYLVSILAWLFCYMFFTSRTKKDFLSLGKIAFISIFVSLPFIVFKLVFWLGFGNGDASVTSTALTLHTEIFSPLYVHMFHMGNYGLFFFFLALLLFVTPFTKKTKQLFHDPKMLYIFSWFLAFGFVIFIYLTTFTYQYVLDGTGINRSMIQILPVFVVMMFISLDHLLTHDR